MCFDLNFIFNIFTNKVRVYLIELKKIDFISSLPIGIGEYKRNV